MTKATLQQLNASAATAAKTTGLHGNADKAADPVNERMLAKAATGAVKQEAKHTEALGAMSSMDDSTNILGTWFDACNATANNEVVSKHIREQTHMEDRGPTFTVW